jgi:hypothetical protein
MSSLPAAATAPRRARWRWFVALLATVLMVVAGSGLVAFAQSGAGASRGPVFLPANTSVYVEGRLDMPDGQAEALAGFMSAFPGFADSGSFMLKVQEALDGALSSATNGQLSYTKDLAPFMTGEIALGVTDLAAAAMADPSTSQSQPPVLVGVAVSDTQAASAFIDQLVKSAPDGMTVTEEPYGSTNILTSSDSSMSLALADDWILLAPTADAVKTGIDVLGGVQPSLAEQPAFGTAWARVPTGHLVAAYVDLQSMGGLLEMASQATAGQTGMSFDLGALAAQLPTDMVAYLTAASDRLTVQAIITPSAQTPAMAVGESDLASLFPSDTQLYVETRELGATLSTLLQGLVSSMDEQTAAQLAPLEDMFGAPLPDLLDFVSDAAVGASISSDGLSLGIAGEVTDQAVATERVQRILSFVRLIAAGTSSGDGASAISMTESKVAGTTVTTITLPIDAATGGQLPIQVPQTLSVAVADGRLLIGLGDFVETALTQDQAGSLAASPGYVDALGSDTTNSGVVYANVGSLLSLLDPAMSMFAQDWSTIAPYATAIDRFIAVGTAGDQTIEARMSVIVAPPAE